MTIDKKIKFVRKLRKMTQPELGVAVALEEKGMLLDMAKTMDINPLNFVNSQMRLYLPFQPLLVLSHKHFLNMYL